MTPFRRRRRGRVTATFEPYEAALLSTLAGQIVELLSDRVGTGESDPDPLVADLGLGGERTPPDDAVLARLLPSAYEDEEDAAEFRRYTEKSLSQGKISHARAIIAGLSPAADDATEQDEVELELDEADQQAWLRGLTDIRLALATRLGIEDDADTALFEANEVPDELRAMYDIYNWIGYVQETLVQSL